MYRFAECELDPLRRELRRAGQAVHLEPQAFDLLVYLIERSDRVVTKHQLLDGVWGHLFVSEANLTTRVKEIRRAVGDDGRQQHTIKNLRGLGYRFVAEVSVDADSDARPANHPDEEPDTRVALVGRDSDADTVRDLLVRSPLVTLVGPGGVGKSSLARFVAGTVASAYPDGVHIVELATISEGEHVLPSVARVLDIVLDREHPENAIRSIARLEALVVIDNCEHVVDDVSALLDRVLTIARVQVLATSQVRLGLSDETVVTLHTLTSDQALELFAMRAKAVNQDWDIERVGTDRVLRLVGVLDHLPLAIEMAAARLGWMSFDDLELAIDQGMQSLQLSHRAPNRRHRSLESMVSWSADLLEPRDRRALTNFSVFAGPVAAADASSVVSADSDTPVVFTLASLAERSLLVADVDNPSTRYRMLFTVRNSAARWLDDDPDRSIETHRRHALHFANALGALDRQIRTSDESEGRARLAEISAEVRAAHHWAQIHDPELAADMSASLHLAAYSTFWNEPIEWSSALIARHPDAAPNSLLGARLILGGAAANNDDLGRARTELAPVEHASDPRLRATALEILSDVELYAGEFDAVIPLTDELRRLGTDLHDPHCVVIAAVNASLAATFGGHPGAALQPLDEVDLTTASVSDRGWICYARGEALSVTRDAGAVQAFREAIDFARSIGNPFVLSVSQDSLGFEYAKLGAHEIALDVFADCLRGHHRHGNLVHAVTTLHNMLESMAAGGDDEGAAVVAGAVSSNPLRKGLGYESPRVAQVLHGVERRSGATRFAEWTERGRLLDVEQTMRYAGERIGNRRV